MAGRRVLEKLLCYAPGGSRRKRGSPLKQNGSGQSVGPNKLSRHGRPQIGQILVKRRGSVRRKRQSPWLMLPGTKSGLHTCRSALLAVTAWCLPCRLDWCSRGFMSPPPSFACCFDFVLRASGQREMRGLTFESAERERSLLSDGRRAVSCREEEARGAPATAKL